MSTNIVSSGSLFARCPVPDLDHARQFINALAGDSTPLTFQTFDDSGEKRKELSKIIHAQTFDNGVAEELLRLNNLGAGVFVTVNQTDGKGRRKSNIVALRALFIDADDIPPPTSWHVQPHLLVQRDPRHYHGYWRLASGSKIEAFSDSQKRLSTHYGSDNAVNDTCRVMRVPGFLHRKGIPTFVKFETLSQAAPLRLEDVVSSLPVPTKQMSNFTAWALKVAKDVVEGNRNNTLFRIACEGNVRKLPIEFVKGILIRNSKGLEESEIDAILTSANSKERVSAQASHCSPYSIVGNCICIATKEEEEWVQKPLCNFSAQISSEITIDDGAEKRRIFTIEGVLKSGEKLPGVRVRAEEFSAMNWLTPAFGVAPVLYAGPKVKDHVRCAIQLASDQVSKRTIYSHTGWTQIRGDYVYLHASGAIGNDGLVPEVDVELPDALTRFDLPIPTSGAELVDSVRASLGLLDGLVPDKIGIPALSVAYRAPLGSLDFIGHVYGPTGAGKTEFVALIQSHFGQNFSSRTLPAGWNGTPNALEAICFAAKDTVLVVDDFAPGGSSSDINGIHRTAARLIRSIGNKSGRERLRSDTSLRPTKPPRGLILSTGEDIPRGESIRARMILLELPPGVLNFARLTAIQSQAQSGVFAVSIAGYIQWLAPHFNSISKNLPINISELRRQVAARIHGHARTIDAIASLLFGFWKFLEFALSIGAIDAQQRDNYLTRAYTAFIELGEEQALHQRDQDEADRYLRLASSAILSGRAHLKSVGGARPLNYEHWGWDSSAEPLGAAIGWLADNGVFLDPDSTYAVVQQLAQAQGEPLGLQQRAIHSRLKSKGHLIATESDKRGTLTVRRVCGGSTRNVLVIKAEALRKIEPISPPKIPIPANSSIAPNSAGQSPRTEPDHNLF